MLAPAKPEEACLFVELQLIRFLRVLYPRGCSPASYFRSSDILLLVFRVSLNAEVCCNIISFGGNGLAVLCVDVQDGQFAYPGVLRGTEDWNTTYKIRTVVERDIDYIKENLCLAGRRTQNEKTLHADLILAGITQLITVVLADKINHHEFIRSLKPLIA